MKKILSFFFVLCVLVPFSTAIAQEVTPSIVDTTIPVSEGIRTAVNAWLETSAPAPLPYWAITYVGEENEETGDIFVSVVALAVADHNVQWRITDNSVVTWMGSVIVHADQTVEVYSDGGYAEDQARKVGGKLATPLLDGGGGNVRFPWDSGTSMMYGTRGVHAAGGGADYAVGFSAVDFLGGNDLGSGVASDRVYAVATGEVDYVCQDPVTTLIRTENTETNDYYIYAHLLENLHLTEGYTFYQGDYIGSLKHGTFDDNCGWAEQTAQHYHLHFGFKFSGGYFAMEGCVLSLSSQKWTCGTKTITTGQFIMNGWGMDPNASGDDANAYSQQTNFWDYMLLGASEMWDQFIIQNMPDHTANQFLYALYNGISVSVRVARVMVYSNINLGHLVAAVIFGLGIKAVLGLAEFVMFLFKAWKSLIPIIGA